MQSKSRLLTGILTAVSVLGFAPQALADRSTIKSDTDHPNYFFEAEPHLVVAPFHGGDVDVGVGFQGTFNVADKGFITPLNDSVGVGFGVNWTNHDHWHLSAAMQWNFWLSEKWSVFGEPGAGVRLNDEGNGKADFWPSFGAGGRFHFTRNITLTMRVGFPVSAVGVSFLL
jgi:hypothetical protein